jgi:hypothetical protein
MVYMSGVNSYQDRVKFIQDLRAYYRVRASNEKYKKWFSKKRWFDNGRKYGLQNINYAEKFCNIVINGIQDDFIDWYKKYWQTICFE